MMLIKFLYEKEYWAFVQTGNAGRFIRTSEIIGVNPAPLLRLASEAMHALGTPDAKTMAANVVMALCELGPEVEPPKAND